MKSIQQCVSDYVSLNNTTKDALAKQVGIGRTSFFSKLRGTSEFTLGEAYRLAKQLGCTTDEIYLMTIEYQPPEPA